MSRSAKHRASHTPHLSEEALDDLLIGVASAADEGHLAACEACSSRLASFRESMDIFNQASSAWSEARSNTIPRELIARRSTHSAAAAWSLASVGLLAVAASLTSYLHRSPELTAAWTNAQYSGQQASTARQPDGSESIADDNAMLAAIDSKLSEPVHSPVVSYGSAATTPENRRAASREVSD